MYEQAHSGGTVLYFQNYPACMSMMMVMKRLLRKFYINPFSCELLPDWVPRRLSLV